MSDYQEKTIDLDRILHDKMGSKARYVPRMAITWLNTLPTRTK